MKSAIVTFFDSYPPRSGSGRVCCDFYKSWPGKKKLFQLSTKKVRGSSIETILIKKNNPFYKILNIVFLIKNIRQYLDDKKKNYLIIEGPSWIFYSYLLILYFKIIFYKNIFIIYRSHSIEYEIRLRNSNYLIAIITKFFEDVVLKYSNISTSVSKKEQKKFYQLYKKKTYFFPNSLNINNLKNLKVKKISRNLPKKFILFSGSYEYKPNREAINFIIKELLPNILKHKIYLVLTGNQNKNFNINGVINLKFIKEDELKYVNKKSICMLVPIFEGYGTRIKILESLVWGNRIISTKKGIEGIEFKKNKNITVTNNKNIMIDKILLYSKNNKKFINHKNIKNFSMEINTKKLFDFSKKLNQSL